jgi:hypothetical protein
MFWAASENNWGKYTNAFSPAFSKNLEDAKKEFGEVAAGFSSFKNAQDEPPAKGFRGYNIVSMETDSNDKIHYQIKFVCFDGTEQETRMYFRRVGNEWRLSSVDE